MPDLKINLAKSAGFCFGVKRALDIALSTARANKKVYMFGDIVHNEEVVKDIERAGIKKIKHLKKEKGAILLIRAHGLPLEAIKRAKKANFRIIDATCPMVKEIHRICREAEADGFSVIVIGDKLHDEVQGIIGQLKKKALVIENAQSLPLDKLKNLKRACVVSQSTQNIAKVLKIVAELEKIIPEIKFFNTICQPTRTKQDEINRMPVSNDVMIIIGSRTSANTRRLFEISRDLNKRSYWVSSSSELKPEWFKKALSVGVTAGASTPEKCIREVVKAIKKFRPRH